MANHLIIGLGGTGGKIIHELRQHIFETFGGNTPDNEIHVKYLYVDCSTDDLNQAEKWCVGQKSIGLFEAEKVDLHDIPSDLLQEYNKYPFLQAVINEDELETLGQWIQPFIASGLSGQCRRMGRILLGNNLCRFEQRLRNAVSQLQVSRCVICRICLFCAKNTNRWSMLQTAT